MKKPQYNRSLKERFNEFLCTRIGSVNLDEVDIGERYSNLKRADYILSNNIIVELKSLESDPSYKIEKKLSRHRDRKDFPFVFGEVPLHDILKLLPDGEEISKDIYFSVTKSLQNAFENADDQINDTKTIIDNSNATGVLAILNENIDVLEPKLIAYIAQYMMNKRKEDGSIRYNNVHFSYLISEAHYEKIGQEVATPIIIIHGPKTTDHPKAIEQFVQYNKEWAKYNNSPLFESDNSVEDRMEHAYEAFKTTKKENN